MNNIIKKLGTKRRYIRHPLCANLSGICEFNKCRCDYSIKTPKGKLPPLDKHLHHRQKVIKHIRKIDLQKLDNEIEPDRVWVGGLNHRIKGYVPSKKKYYGRLLLNGFLILLAVAFLYPLVIIIYDLTNRV